MAVNGIVKSAQKRLTWLGVIAGLLAGIIGLGMLFGAAGASFAPQLSLDLQGGTQIILTPQLASGKTVSKDQLDQAVAIIRQRVDATGVGEASITTQGDNNIVVSIPGKPDDNTLKLIEASAKLQFRAVLATSAGVATAAVGGSTDSRSASPSASPLSTSSAKPTDGSDLNWIDKDLQAKYDALDCSKQFRAAGQVDNDNGPLITCDTGLTTKYILGPERSRVRTSPTLLPEL
ncbi:MAG: hypothetical protein RJA26_771 [Actinomycetota bacterium]